MVPNRSGRRVIVVGGGIAGLSAAYRLSQSGYEVTVLEKDDQVGGRMVTAERQGYRFDVAASLLPSAYTAMRRLVDDAGLASSVQPSSDLASIVDGGVHHHLHLASRLGLPRSSLLGPRSKAGLFRAAISAKRHRSSLRWDDLSGCASLDRESIQEYADRRFGPEAIDLLIEPVSNEVYFADPAELSVVHLLFFLERLLPTGFFSSPEGVAFLPRGLARQLHVELSAEVRSVEEARSEVTVTWSKGAGPERTDRADAAVIAVPVKDVSGIHPQLAPERREVLNGFSRSAYVVTHLGLSKAPATPAMWLLVPRSTSPDLVGVVMEHNKATGRVPPGCGLAGAHWRPRWCEEHLHESDDQITSHTLKELEKITPGISGTVVFSSVTRFEPCCVPLRSPGTFRALQESSRGRAGDSRIVLAGDYFGLASTNTALASGERAARYLSGRLGP
ncbi:protoporphyrinogen/coproporphyrinogen oxidase [Actinomadura rubrisoli]|nr:NAD(P)/FAD-dependent oxidoreductase [Actinomadura rubrisoli]